MQSDAVTLAEAARLIGRSVDTVRRWVHEGKLDGERASQASNAPLMVPRNAVLALAGSSASAMADMRRAQVPSQARADADDAASLRKELARLEAHLTDVRADRDRLAVMLDAANRRFDAMTMHLLTPARGERVTVDAELAPAGERVPSKKGKKKRRK